MGALLGVAQGSVRAAAAAGACAGTAARPGEAPVVFVGKGVTFDTGGISIKPAAGMEAMKWDMGGAGAVAGAMKALASRKAKANVVGVCGAGREHARRQRPAAGRRRHHHVGPDDRGDQHRRRRAAGAVRRDDLGAARASSPKVMIDLATLTGAMVISLGHEYAGMFSNDDGFADSCSRPARRAATSCGGMPMGEAYDKMIDSPIADMKNVGPREGGSITAARFLQRFVEEGVKWAHLDIAGMAWSDKAEPPLRQGRDRLSASRCSTAIIADTRRSADAGRQAGARSTSTSSARRSRTASSPASPASCSTSGQRLLVVAGDEGAARAARPAAVGPGRGQLPAAWARRRSRRRRASRSCCRPAPTRPTSPATS